MYEVSHWCVHNAYFADPQVKFLNNMHSAPLRRTLWS